MSCLNNQYFPLTGGKTFRCKVTVTEGIMIYAFETLIFNPNATLKKLNTYLLTYSSINSIFTVKNETKIFIQINFEFEIKIAENNIQTI